MNLEKHPPFRQFSSKISEFFWWKIMLFLQLIRTFASIYFWLGCIVQKMDDHFQRPLWPICSKLTTILENDDCCQLSPKQKFQKFWWKLKEYKTYPPWLLTSVVYRVQLDCSLKLCKCNLHYSHWHWQAISLHVMIPLVWSRPRLCLCVFTPLLN